MNVLKLEDIHQLQQLAVEYAEALDPGLSVLDSRVLVGGATVDLLGLDRDGCIVLVVLGFSGDDEMLMRAVEAYSWCSEYPDAIGRQYPAARLASGESPRLIFVAERLPDAFLRKVKHLRLPKTTCLEFRFGLQFLPVDGPRSAEEPHEPPPPPVRAERVASIPERDVPRVERPAPRPDRAVPRVDVMVPRSDVGPPRVEVPTVRPDMPARPLETPVRARPSMGRPGEPDERRVAAVREYLQREFPTAVIYDFYEYDRESRVFLLQDNQGSVVHQAAVAEDVLSTNSEAELRAFFDRHKLARVLRQAGQAAVCITTSGLRVDRR